MDSTQLRHFAAVARQLHFTRAAKELGISRQSLSTTVKDLEAEIGADLFDRSAESTQLTDAGRALLATAERQLADDAERARAEAELAAAAPTLGIAFVPGVTVGKWTAAWEKRHPEIALTFAPGTEAESVDVLHSGVADVSFVRLPVARQGLSVIRLYSETPVVVVSKDHALASFEAVELSDLAELGPGQVVRNPASVHDAVELVAAGVGALVVPQSIARLHARKDVVARPVTDEETTDIAIAWLEDALTPEIEEFVGIVRGRTAASSRSGVGSAESSAPQASAGRGTSGGKGGTAGKSASAAKAAAAGKGGAKKSQGGARSGVVRKPTPPRNKKRGSR